MRVWELVWDGPPPPNMNGSDAHSRWQTRKARVRWRANAQTLAILHDLPTRQIVRYRVSCTFFRRNLGVADEDGDIARLKSVLDGLVDEKYLPEDNRRFAEWGVVDERHGKPGFILRIEELPADAETIARAQRRYARDDGVSFLDQLKRATRRGGAAAAPIRPPHPVDGTGVRRVHRDRTPHVDPGL